MSSKIFTDAKQRPIKAELGEASDYHFIIHSSQADDLRKGNIVFPRGCIVGDPVPAPSPEPEVQPQPRVRMRDWKQQ